MKLFLDTDIIIDLLADRKPFSNAAYEIFKKQKDGAWSLYTSSSSIITTFYILEKQISKSDAKKAIKTILKRIEIVDLIKKDMQDALNLKIEDLEDATQVVCANKVKGLKYLITRDKKGFKNSDLKVLSSDELINTV